MTRPSPPDPRQRLHGLLLANATRARLFVRDPDNGALRELQDWVHPQGRLPGHVLDSDRPGQAMKGQARTAFAPHQDAHRHEAEAFAHELSRALEAAAHDGRLKGWWLLASPPFLGELRAALGPAAAAALQGHAAHDFTALQGAALEQRVSESLAAQGAAGPG